MNNNRLSYQLINLKFINLFQKEDMELIIMVKMFTKIIKQLKKRIVLFVLSVAVPLKNIMI